MSANFDADTMRVCNQATVIFQLRREADRLWSPQSRRKAILKGESKRVPDASISGDDALAIQTSDSNVGATVYCEFLLA